MGKTREEIDQQFDDTVEAVLGFARAFADGEATVEITRPWVDENTVSKICIRLVRNKPVG